MELEIGNFARDSEIGENRVSFEDALDVGVEVADREHGFGSLGRIEKIRHKRDFTVRL
jgi:hypothetical protein